MWNDTRLQELLGTTHPIIQAPMAGASTADMAIAASNAGALGSLGCAMMSETALRDLGTQIKNATNRSVNYNFFCHAEPGTKTSANSVAQGTLKPFYDEFELGEMPEVAPVHFPFGEEICEVLLEISPKVVSFHFGLPEASLVEKLKSAGAVILSSATTVNEARYLETNGADAIIAQGFESGGHRGFFLEPEDACIGTMALVPQIVDAVQVPVIAAGGIADARGTAAAFMLGASGVQIGTAFLNCTEAGIPAAHKRELLASDGSNTRTTKAFSGRPARSIINRYMESMKEHEQSLPDFPLMNTMTGPLRKASGAANKPDFLSLWSGQAVGLNRETTTAEFIEDLVSNVEERLKS